MCWHLCDMFRFLCECGDPGGARTCIPRYVSVVGGKDTMSQASQLLFKWHLELSGEQTKTAERHIRADNAFAIDRGVQLPSEWLELCAPLPAAAMAGRFTAMAAHEAAKDASTGASLKLGDVCTAVDCR